MEIDDLKTYPHVGMVALAGRANVGKSSLVNTLVGEKVTIVSPVAQTTRNTIRAIYTEDRGQLVFLDTPGIHRAKNPLGRRMNKAARAASDGVDVLLLVVDATEPPRMEDDGWMRRIVRRDLPAALVFNKCDQPLRYKSAFLDLWKEILAEAEAEEKENPDSDSPLTRDLPAFETSAVNQKGLPNLLEWMFARLPEGPLLFPADMVSDFPRRWAIADLIREQWFKGLREELPHQMDVCVEELDEVDGVMHVQATVYLERPSQKGILIGAKGRVLQRVKSDAVREILAAYEPKRVKLEIFIKVEPGWRKNFWILRKMGYA